ncbi:hypothetical protein F5883DRAFT_426930 [Diaporthe sp. PMI_573]|jgi:uncharacterized protein YbjT (DUF2867 family)|nr:hypothetical protein F5883DRAFT_426930 [Diaporthaceae sp. PMI_573]
MTAKIAIIVGATSTQGGGIIEFLAGNPDYKLRGFTRNTNSTTTLDLASKGVKVVQANLNNPGLLRVTFAGLYTVYSVIDILGIQAELENNAATAAAEERQGINIAQACLETPSLEHFI